MQTTKAHFELFKKECEVWITKLELHDWKVDYEHKKLDHCYATTDYKLHGRIAVISFSTEWYEKTRPLTPENLKETSKHEVLHILLARLSTCAISRYVTESEVYEADEEIVRKLEHFIK